MEQPLYGLDQQLDTELKAKVVLINTTIQSIDDVKNGGIPAQSVEKILDGLLRELQALINRLWERSALRKNHRKPSEWKHFPRELRDKLRILKGAKEEAESGQAAQDCVYEKAKDLHSWLHHEIYGNQQPDIWWPDPE